MLFSGGHFVTGHVLTDERLFACHSGHPLHVEDLFSCTDACVSSDTINYRCGRSRPGMEVGANENFPVWRVGEWE